MPISYLRYAPEQSLPQPSLDKRPLPVRLLVAWVFLTIVAALLDRANAGEALSSKHALAYPDDAGVIDITRPPYNAIGDGKMDVTAIINRALREHNALSTGDIMMSPTIYFPPGTYLVSDTLKPQSPDGGNRSVSSVRILGAGEGLSTIRLKDNARGYGDRRHPKVVLGTGFANALANSAFNNYVQQLTIDVGAANPGAVGLQYNGANISSVSHVTIRSSDPDKRGRFGLQYMPTSGQSFLKYVTIEGFDIGINFDQHPVNNQVLEHVTLRGQRELGILVIGKNVAIRGLRSENSVTAIRLGRPEAVLHLIEATLSGDLSGGKNNAAIELDGSAFLYVRDIQTTGYKLAIHATRSIALADVPGGAVEEWFSRQTEYTKNQKRHSLRLTIKETPEYHQPDFSKWANPVNFGADPKGLNDSTAAIQAAIDSGAEVVYLPFGRYKINGSIHIRGNIRKFDGLFSLLTTDNPRKAGIIVDAIGAPGVILENLSMRDPIAIEHNSHSTLAIVNHARPGPVRTGSRATGELFIENTGSRSDINVGRGIHAWLRSINREFMPFLNDGGTVWYFGDNIEAMLHADMHEGRARISPKSRLKSLPAGKRSHIFASRSINGAKTEILGGAMDALAAPHTPASGPLFLVEDSEFSATYAGLLWNREVDWGLSGRWPVHVIVMSNGKEIDRITDDMPPLVRNSNMNIRMIFPPFATQQ